MIAKAVWRRNITKKRKGRLQRAQARYGLSGWRAGRVCCILRRGRSGMNYEPDHLTVAELAARWHMARGTLANWRHHGLGLRYIKLGRTVLYPIAAVEEYEREHTVG